MKYILRFYPSTPVLCYKWRAYERPDGRTGTMPTDEFMELRGSIAACGIINPFIVEYYILELHHQPDLNIRVGHNRAECMSQLGMKNGPVLFVVPADVASELPEGVWKELAVEKGLLSKVRELWCDVDRADGTKYYSDAWKDSGLLLSIVREAEGLNYL